MALSYHRGSLSLKPSRRLPLASPGLGVGHSLIPDEIPWSSGLPFRLCTRESRLGEEREDWTLRRKPVVSTTVTSKALHDLAPGNFSDLIFFAAHLFILNPPGLLTWVLVFWICSRLPCTSRTWLWSTRDSNGHISYSSFRILLICYLEISPGSSSLSPKAGLGATLPYLVSLKHFSYCMVITCLHLCLHNENRTSLGARILSWSLMYYTTTEAINRCSIIIF